MRYHLLGKSGLRISELALGTMTFGDAWGWGASEAESRAIFTEFATAGGNFIDTASNYTDGQSEQIVGVCITAERERFVVATKYTLSTQRDDPNAGGNQRKNMVQSVERSLRRLGTDYIDLLWLHMWDGLTPLEEVVRAMDDLMCAGKVLYVGFSDTPAWVIAQAVTLAEQRGWARPIAVQVPYSLVERTIEHDIVPMARSNHLSVLTWGVLEGGELTGKYTQPTTTPRRSDQASAKSLALAEVVQEVAREVSRPPAQVAINWVRQQNAAQIIPILGARSVPQLRSNLACLEWHLEDVHLQRLDAASRPAPSFPGNFLDSDHVKDLIFGDTWHLVDTTR
jgi:aryl-alcohol dehydrogenase-like predicted oxidoreductase